MREPALAAVGKAGGVAQESGMLRACQHRDDRAGCGTRIGLRGSDRARRSWGSSGTRMLGCSRSRPGQKNSLRDVRARAPGVVRSQAAPRPRPLLRGSAHLPRRRGPAGGLPALWHGEAGATRLPGRQSLLHQALRLLRGPALSGLPDPRRGQGAAPRLAHREGVGAAVHARATAPRGDPGPSGDRPRRDLHQEGPRLPHRRQRPQPAAADLVRWGGSLRGEHG